MRKCYEVTQNIIPDSVTEIQRDPVVQGDPIVNGSKTFLLSVAPRTNKNVSYAIFLIHMHPALKL